MFSYGLVFHVLISKSVVIPLAHTDGHDITPSERLGLETKFFHGWHVLGRRQTMYQRDYLLFYICSKKMIDTNALKSITQIHLLGNIPLSPMRQAPISVVCMAMRTSKVAPVCVSNKEGQFGAA